MPRIDINAVSSPSSVDVSMPQRGGIDGTRRTGTTVAPSSAVGSVSEGLQLAEVEIANGAPGGGGAPDSTATGWSPEDHGLFSFEQTDAQWARLSDASPQDLPRVLQEISDEYTQRDIALAERRIQEILDDPDVAALSNIPFRDLPRRIRDWIIDDFTSDGVRDPDSFDGSRVREAPGPLMRIGGALAEGSSIFSDSGAQGIAKPPLIGDVPLPPDTTVVGEAPQPSQHGDIIITNPDGTPFTGGTSESAGASPHHEIASPTPYQLPKGDIPYIAPEQPRIIDTRPPRGKGPDEPTE